MMLRHFRLKHRQRTLWIDALCIDQDDHEERSAQVKMMRQIYSQCSKCLAWLLEYKVKSGDIGDWRVLEDCSYEAVGPSPPDEYDEEVQVQMEEIRRGITAWSQILGLYLDFIGQTKSENPKQAKKDAEARVVAWSKAVGEDGEALVEFVSTDGWETKDEPETDDDEAKRVILETAEEVIGTRGSDEDEHDRLYMELFPGDPHETFRKITELLIKHMSDLGSVFNRPSIWNRVWTMQELINAPFVVLYAGQGTREVPLLFLGLFLRQGMTAGLGRNHHIALLTFEKLFSWVAFNGVERIIRQRRVMWAADSFMRFRNIRSSMYKASLWHILQLFDTNKASDPRDYVYGLLGLVTEDHKIEVDYEKSVAQVFMETTVSIINTSGNLDILCQLSIDTLKSDTPVPESTTICHNEEDLADAALSMGLLPSWVPNFSAHISYGNKKGVIFAGDLEETIYQAGKQQLQIPGALYVVEGEYLGINIIALGAFDNDEFCTQPESTLEATMWLPGNWLDEYEDGFSILYDFDDSRRRYEQTGESAFQAYWRTLLRDCKAEPLARITAEDISSINGYFWEVSRFYERIYNGKEDAYDVDAILKEKWQKLPSRIQTQLDLNLTTWRFAMTDSKLYAMVKNVKEGDIVAVADGAKVPLVLRRIDHPDDVESLQGREVYSLVGTAYVHGFMNGEAIREVNLGIKREERIWLR